MMFWGLAFSLFSWRLVCPNLSWMFRNCLRTEEIEKYHGTQVDENCNQRDKSAKKLDTGRARSKGEFEHLEEEEAERGALYTRT